MPTFLIDGYNLMHAAGMAGAKRVGRLEKARNRFLDWLSELPGVKAGAVLRIVFDAQNGTADDGERPYRAGVWVRFAYRQTADDLIERLLTTESAGLTVVSNDGRVLEAARRRGAARWGCEAFLDWAATGSPGPGTAMAERTSTPEKPDATPEAERDELLAAFQAPKPR